MEIKFCGTPFILTGNQTYQPHQGKDFNVSKKIYYYKAKKESFISTFLFQITKTYKHERNQIKYNLKLDK